MLTVTQHAEGNHFIIPLLRSFNISLSATSLTHKEEIGLGLFLSGARSTSTLLMAPSIGLCQSLFCSLQVTLTPFVGSVSFCFSFLSVSIWSCPRFFPAASSTSTFFILPSCHPLTFSVLTHPDPLRFVHLDFLSYQH